MPDVIAIAHRGDPIGGRENTPAAFAVRRGRWAPTGSSSTCGSLADGVVVVLHDQSLQRLWGRDVSVGDVDLAEVQRLGDDDVRIPTLAEVLAAVAAARLMVDFTRREVVAGALDAVRAAGALERSLFVTGNVEALRLLRGLSGEARIGLTWVEGTEPPAGLLRELGAEYWNPMFDLVTPSRRGRGARPWAGRCRPGRSTRDEDMHRVVQAGVDAVVSNRIGDLLRFLGRGMSRSILSVLAIEPPEERRARMGARQRHATSRWAATHACLTRPRPGGGARSRRGAGLRAARIGPRLRALALTVVLIVATLGIGWLIWSVVEWRRGRTPGLPARRSARRPAFGRASGRDVRAAPYAGSAAPS